MALLRLASLALSTVLLGPIGPEAFAQKAPPAVDPCADLGSYAVVDAAPVPRGAPIVAGSHNPCADLPGPAQPPIFIDAQVQIGNGANTPGQPGPGQSGPGLANPVGRRPGPPPQGAGIGPAGRPPAIEVLPRRR